MLVDKLTIPCHTGMKTVACFSCHIMSCLGMKEQYSWGDEEVDTVMGCFIFYVELYISQSLSRPDISVSKTNEPNIHGNYWRDAVCAFAAMPCVL